MRGSGGEPWWLPMVPAESIWKSSVRPALLTICRNTISAAGERQMFPRQTNRMRCGGCMCGRSVGIEMVKAEILRCWNKEREAAYQEVGLWKVL